MPRKLLAAILVTLLAGCTDPPKTCTWQAAGPAPLIIAHRGASGYVPEHTLAAYSLAILQGADYIEPDLVSTRDGHLVARHDNLLNLSTDVASRPAFAARKTTKVIDGEALTGWFSEDFTLAELKTLRAVERVPQLRPDNARLDGQFAIPTLQEIIDLAQAMGPLVGREIGLYPETKHPSYFASIDLALEAPLVALLHRNGYRAATDKVFIQSFEVSNLKRLNQLTELKLVQLLYSEGQPADEAQVGGSMTYADMATPEGLGEIARYADAVGPEKNHFILAPGRFGSLDLAGASRFVADAHAVGLLVHPYTFRAENYMLPYSLWNGFNPRGRGNVEQEICTFLSLGIDGLFTDQVDAALGAMGSRR